MPSPRPRSSQPLVLRREPFGGILFDPACGTQIELDAEGFETARAWCKAGTAPASPEGEALLARLRGEVPALERPPVPLRLHEGVAPPARRSFAPLAAPTLVDLQLTQRCAMGCPHCYVAASADGVHMAYSDALLAMRACAEAGVCQVAIGGGEPLLHPRLADVLEEAHALGLVPNLTTTGDGLTEAALDAMARCCGAVALSLEGVGPRFDRVRRQGFSRFEAVLDRLADRGVPTVLQVTLSAESLPDLPAVVDYCLGRADLYGVILLAYKAVGRGECFDAPLATLPPREVRPLLSDALVRLARHTRAGYDCCLTPGLAGFERELGLSGAEELEGCSAARSSVGVTVDLEVVPCTFLAHRPLGSLRSLSLREVWAGPGAETFRERLEERAERLPACRACPSQSACLGGCPEWDLVGCALR